MLKSELRKIYLEKRKEFSSEEVKEKTVQVGELRPIDAGMTRLAQLPEVVVRGKREFGSHYAAATQLPEVVVVAKRIAHMVAKDEVKAEHGASPAINAGF